MSAHSHHSASSDPLSIAVSGLLERVFCFDPLSNAVLAVCLLAGVTQVFIGVSPHLSGAALQFCMAFATGSMLGTIFLHLLPETHPSQLTSLLILTGFLFFVVLDKIARVFGNNQHAHSHSTTQPSPNTTKNPNFLPLLNVLADSLHNFTEGVSLRLAFDFAPSVGVSAVLVMAAHEIPHQFGDFALLLSSGLPKKVARRVQLVSVLGTLLGVLLGEWLHQSQNHLVEMVTPVTMGVFLYVATMNVLPELLETNSALGVWQNTKLAGVQVLGVLTGIGVLMKLGHAH